VWKKCSFFSMSIDVFFSSLTRLPSYMHIKQQKRFFGKLALIGFSFVCFWLGFHLPSKPRTVALKFEGAKVLNHPEYCSFHLQFPIQKGWISPVYKRFKSKIIEVKIESLCTACIQFITWQQSDLHLWLVNRFDESSFSTCKSSRAPPLPV
jgi:hypothetical protein